MCIKTNNLKRPRTRRGLLLIGITCLIYSAGSFATGNQEDKLRELNAQRMDGEGLSEIKNKHKNGGTMVDLKGRFGSPTTAIIGPDGKVLIGHYPLPCEDDHDDQGKHKDQIDTKDNGKHKGHDCSKRGRK